MGWQAIHSYQWARDSKRCLESIGVTQVQRKTHEAQHQGIPDTPDRVIMHSAWDSPGGTRDLPAGLWSYWHNKNPWSVRMERYKLFRRDRQRRWEGGDALHDNREHGAPASGDGLNESLWVRTKGRAGTSDSIISLWGCLNRKIKLMRSSTHREEWTSYSHILVLMGNFSHPRVLGTHW